MMTSKTPRKAIKTRKKRQCLICKGSIPANENGLKKFCSVTCRRKAAKIRYKAKYNAATPEGLNQKLRAAMSAMLCSAKIRAEKRGIPFDLTLDDIVIPTTCPVLGITIGFDLKQGKGPKNNSPSLDRLIPELGYVRSNVQVVSWRANRIKSDATLEELIKITLWANTQHRPL